ncbi:zona pellucida sperm-binding protein 3d.2 isoform X1 [Amphiprion ocellaris]|uniref:Zona pellucida sperm-binding protein 3 n=1 Tax=Amphiprion ocellaris TaxID=80972 RepID=A0A3Q1BDP1_AMPOC|nr:zona pellucida sperm-binding protein 3d.2 isoform X1 [Amphiprion ocellaris]
MCVNMLYLPLLLLLPLLPSTEGRRASQPPAQVMRRLHRRNAPYLDLPMFVDSRQPLVQKEHFSPVKGTGQEPLPGPLREVLLPARPSATPPSASGVSVKTSCERRKMRVQVERGVLGSGDVSGLKLGTCSVTTSTKDHLYFEYDFCMCGTKRTIIDNQVAYTNTLRYDPPMLQGPIRRSVPFTLPVACYFNRYQYSYKIGYTPKVQLRKVFKQMMNGAKFILTPRNAQWERLSPSDQYVLGKPMYFEAEALPTAHDERLYVHSCYATPERSHTSTPQFPVVTNFGCMVESKDSRSRFIPHKNNVVRFSVDAFLFKGVTGQQLYMHCTMSVSSSVPSPITKSCNYDTKAKRWVELFGPDSVCTCCDSNCSSAASTVTQIISSKSWKIEPKAKLTTTKRKVVYNTTTTTTTTTTTQPTAAQQPETTREVTKRKRMSTPEKTAVTVVGKAENMEEELEWPFGGGGVVWEEEKGEEKQVKGSAVVEEKEVGEPRRIFEEIFDFDE